MSSTKQPSVIDHTVHLLPPDTTLAEQNQITADLHKTRSAFTYSADAAHAIAAVGSLNSKVVVWSGERWRDDIFAWFKGRGINTQARQFDGQPPSQAGHNFGNTQRSRSQPSRIKHTIHLFPQDINLAEVHAVTAELHATKSAFAYSADVVHALVHVGNSESEVIVWSGDRWTGDIFAWLKDRGLPFQSERIKPIGGSSFLFTHWPTEHSHINQGYNKNPALYQAIELPGGAKLTGHEGLDIRAPLGSKIFAVADGTVIRVRALQEGHNYGIAIYLRHRDGYRTTYAHLESVADGIKPNAHVKGGQLLGRGDSTGNVRPKNNPAAASHLHLTLYHDGATRRGETEQPFDIIDPVPYLQHLPQYQTAIAGGGTAQPPRNNWEAPQAPFIAGWAFAKGLKTEGVLAQVNSNQFINLRMGAGSDHALIGRVFNGTIVKITDDKKNGYFPVLVSEEKVTRTRKHTKLELGMHNEDGGEWMLRNGVKGWTLQNLAIGSGGPQPVNGTRFANAGIKLLVRLNYGFGSTGTIPRDEDPHYETFIQSCIKTMERSQGVWGYIIANETNNSNEFPGNHKGQGGQPITPERYAKLYNRIWQGKPAGARITPQAVDPYFNPAFILGIDSRDYWRRTLENIIGADFLTMHPKTQDSNPDSVDSDVKFAANGPLHWQFFHLKSYIPLLEVVPGRFRGLPVIATEVNPQRHNDQSKLGWQENLGAEWVRRAVQHFKTYNATAAMPITGVIFYRFRHDEWELHNKPSILAAIKKAA